MAIRLAVSLASSVPRGRIFLGIGLVIPIVSIRVSVFAQRPVVVLFLLGLGTVWWLVRVFGLSMGLAGKQQQPGMVSKHLIRFIPGRFSGKGIL